MALCPTHGQKWGPPWSCLVSPPLVGSPARMEYIFNNDVKNCDFLKKIHFNCHEIDMAPNCEQYGETFGNILFKDVFLQQTLPSI